MTASTTLAGLTIRLEPERRLRLADRLVDLCTAAIRLRHDQADRLARISATQFYGPRTDRVLLAGLATLTAFVKDRAEDGITLPTWHPCYVPSAVVEGGE